jgi:CubicO group peptidase (beta-lactamase class C family)
MSIRCVHAQDIVVAAIAAAMSVLTPTSSIADNDAVYGEMRYSRLVHRGETVSMLPRGEQIAAPSTALPLDDFFERSRTSGVIVLKDGKIVFERYMHGTDEHTLLYSASMAKSFTSTLVGFAIGDGLIRSVDDPISDYLPELKGSGYDGVPIKAVLQMSSGVAWNQVYGTPDSDVDRMFNESLVLNKTPITDFARSAKRRSTPFFRFSYAGVDAVAIGWLVSRVTGKNLTSYLSEKLWVPLGMEADAKWVTDGDGPAATEAITCCLRATLRDYARFGLLMAQNGVWNGKQLLRPTWVKEATQPDRPQVGNGKLYSGYTLGYQYYWWTFPGEDHAFEAQGTRGQFIYVNPRQNLVIVMTNDWPRPWDTGLEAETYALFKAFEAALRR